MIALHLLLFAALTATVGPRWLGEARWVYRSPRLGIAAWYAVVGGVVSAVVAATISLVVPQRQNEAAVCAAWRWCVQAVRGDHGVAGRLAAAAVVLAALVLAGRFLLCAFRFRRAQGAERRQQLQLLRLAGREAPELGATVVQCAEPAAYMVAGHHRRVVVTTGAMAALNEEELSAVLAHEHAHAAGRHDVLLNGLRLLRTAFPRLSLFVVAWDHLSRLVEMRADEVAVTHHRPISLARALVAMAGASSVPGTPTTAVPATGGDAMARLKRLLDPPDRLTTGQSSAIGAAVLLVAAAPVLTAALGWLLPGAERCLLFLL